MGRKKNATNEKAYKGWTIEVSGRGPGRWEVLAGKDHRWYAVGTLDGRVKDAFELGKEWVDSRTTLRGRVRGLSDEQIPAWRRRRNPCVGLHLHNEDLVPVLQELERSGRLRNPCVGVHLHSEDLVPVMRELEKMGRVQKNPCLIVGDKVRLDDGEEGEVETVVRGQVFVRTKGRQLRGANQDDLVLIKGGELREELRRKRNPGVPGLKRWKKERDDCDQWTYAVGHEDGIFMIWQPASDPAYGCETDGTWRAAFIPDRGTGGLVSGDLERPQEGVEWARRQLPDGATASPNPKSSSALKRRLMGGGATRNPSARPLYVDDLTGTRVSGLVPGATRTFQKVVRTRPAPGEPFQVVEAHGDTMDPRRDTYGIDSEYTQFYRDEAGRVAKEEAKIRKQEPLPRDADIELGKLGIATTFKNVKQALDVFEDGNEQFFLHPLLDDLDAGDLTHDFMDRLEVGRGKRATAGGRAAKRKHVRLSETARGQEILDLHGQAQVKAMIKYMFGLAGRRRRWRDVPWYMIDDYMEQIGTQMGYEPGSAGGSGSAYWYPLASGQLSEAEFLTRAAEEIGPKKAAKLERHMNSQALWRYVDRLEDIVKPPKGPAGKDGRKALKCIPKEDRKLLRHRLRVLTDWAKYPELVPEWACVPSEKSQVMTICEYPAIGDDVLGIQNACHEPYDATWPARQRAELWEQGDRDQYGTGVYPMEPPDLPTTPRAEVEELDLPWETAANPRRERLKRKLMR